MPTEPKQWLNVPELPISPVGSADYMPGDAVRHYKELVKAVYELDTGLLAQNEWLRERVKELEGKCERLRLAFHMIDWMAENYADAGGRYGPERRDFDEAKKLLTEPSKGDDDSYQDFLSQQDT